MTTIDFSDVDFETASAAADRRHDISRAKGHEHTAGLSATIEEQHHLDLIGALGEIALARALEEQASLSEGTYKAADHVDRWGTHWHIRTTERADGRLIVRPRDKRSGRYALVVVDMDGRNATITGQCLGKMVDALGSDGDGGNGRDAAIWVQRRALKGIEDYLERKTTGV